VHNAVHRFDELFWNATQLAPGEERDSYLALVCGDNPALRKRLERLLQVQPKVEGFLERPFPGPGQLPTFDDRPAEGPGTVIGPYKLLEQIGEGGMGLVFMAEQTRPLRRRVALKVIKPGMDTRQVVARFQAERQALALMDHPNIAKIHDAGATDSGRPYFVMELVKGVPITEFCDQRRLTMRQRLELFVTVCQAVQHAHQKGIIHRDLKPSNVLVTLHDIIAVPKIIDFGIAKATTQPLTERTLFTNFAQMMGTPLYMSPEQAEMNGLDVDTRSDVYALGVLLYELLTGTTPFESQTLKKVGLDEMRRMIREEEPPTPSQRLSTLDARLCETVSERRGVDGRRLGQALRGELDWIVMKALEKDRDRRYESASAFAADVQRYLNDEAVVACPPSAGYRLRKFARRNRRPLVTAAVIMMALVAASVVSVWQAVVALDAQHQAEADRDRARSAEGQALAAESRAATESAIARAANEFLQEDLLGQAASAPPPDREFTAEDPYLTVREALDRAAARIDQRFQDQPLVEAAIRTAIGSAYNRLSERQRAIPHLERAVQLRKAHLVPHHPDTLASMHELAGAYGWAGRILDAIALCQHIQESQKARFGPDHPDTLAAVAGLAEAYRFAGQWDKSTPLVEQLLEKRRAICGPTHPDTVGTMHNLAMNYAHVGRFAESMALLEKVLVHLKSTETAGSQPSSWSWLIYAQVCQRAGKLDKAEQVLREALERNRHCDDSLRSRHQKSNILGWLALNRLLQHQYHDAEPLAREAVAITERLPLVNARRFLWMGLLGAALLGQEKYAEAEPFLLQGYEGFKQQERILPADEKPRLRQMGEWVVRLYEATNQPEKAGAWREKLKARVK
jgi:serine/threonine protein kinase